MRNLLNEITIGETCLFRSMAQVDALRKIVIPSLTEAKKKLAYTKLRVWSAGCSTGEETYTLAMILLEETRTNLKGWTFEVVATDLNDRSVAKAQEGVYNDYAVRNVPPEFMKKYFTKIGQEFRVADSVRPFISFNRMNMLDESKMLFMRGFDVIFCCNVLIYFDGKSKTRTIQHFYNSLLPSGYFFLGHSESLFGISEKFRLVHFPGTTAYWKAGESAVKGMTP
jgi:chemotaxis protein methyltransferase CheR